MPLVSARGWARVSSVVALGALLGAVLAGCSGSGGSGADKPAAAPTKTAPASASASPSAAALDGTDLNAALLPASAMPPGYRLDSSSERDTGTSTAPDTTGHVSAPCGMLGDTSWIDATGIVAGSFAQDDYVNKSETEEIAQEADAYTTADAEHAMTALWRILGTCAHFTDGSASITMTRSQLAVGDQAVEAVQTSPAYQGGTTIVAVRVGDVIVTTLDSSAGNDKGSAAVGYATRIARNISARM
jgi:hypothetical protein